MPQRERVLCGAMSDELPTNKVLPREITNAGWTLIDFLPGIRAINISDTADKSSDAVQRELNAIVNAALDPNGHNLVALNMSGIQYIHPGGIRHFIQAKHDLAEKGGNLALADLNADVKRSILEAGLGEIFQFFTLVESELGSGKKEK